MKKTSPPPVFAPDQPHRIERLRALLDHEQFAGNQAALGRFLGYSSGAYVRQMLAGERPILEKTITRVETALAGKFAGWFGPKVGLGEQAMRLALHFDANVPPEQQHSLCTSLIETLNYLVQASKTVGTSAPAQLPTVAPRAPSKTLLS